MGVGFFILFYALFREFDLRAERAREADKREASLLRYEQSRRTYYSRDDNWIEDKVRHGWVNRETRQFQTQADWQMMVDANAA